MDNCRRLEAIEKCIIFEGQNGQFAIVTFVSALSNYLTAVEAKDTDLDDFDNQLVILQTEQYRIEILEKGWHLEVRNQLCEFTASSLPELVEHVLIVIFSRMDLKTLANVARCCSRFQSIARSVFSNEFNGLLVLDHQIVKSSLDRDHMVEEFGRLARSLVVSSPGPKNSYEDECTNCRNLFSTVDPQKLTGVHFSGHLASAFTDVVVTDHQHLPLLQHLTIIAYDSPETTINLYQLNPELKTCHLYGDIRVDNGTNVKGFVESLHIRRNDLIQEEVLKQLITLHDNITDLAVCDVTHLSPFPNEFFDYLYDACCHKNLTKLSFCQWWEHSKLLGENPYDMQLTETLVHFKKLTNLKIRIGTSIADAFNAEIIGALCKLEMLEISCNKVEQTRPRIGEGFFDGIFERLPKLKKFHIMGYEVDEDEWNNLIIKFPDCCLLYSLVSD